MKDKKPTAQMSAVQTADFENMVRLLSVLTESTNQLNALQNEANEGLLEILDDGISTYAKLQQAATEAESALELIARKHPEWFEVKKSIKTPYGTLKFTESTVIEIPNEEVTLILIDNESRADATFDPAKFKREVITVNVEALEGLDDVTLARLRCKRVTKQNFKVTPATLDMGKAIKEAVETPQAQAA